MIHPFHFLQIRKCTHVLRQCFHRYQKKKKSLPEDKRVYIEQLLKDLQKAILEKNIPLAKEKRKQAESLYTTLLAKSLWERSVHFSVGLCVALALAILIRQLWFEFYEIPTGSMRPTLKEQDRLVVSKTSFGINLPLSTDHLYFSNDLVQRNGIIVFTGEDMDIQDVDTLYFYLFPGKKQYVKRLMAKPGDTVYFYGGRLYGVDKEGKDISPLLQPPQLDLIEHVPFLQFEGKVSTPPLPTDGIYTPVVLKQMNEPIARLSVLPHRQATGQLLVSGVEEYSDLWGIKNFGMARLLKKAEVLSLVRELPPSLEAPYYLEIRHHPSLQKVRIERDTRGRLRPMLGASTSFLPLNESHLKILFDNLYTVRFVVEKGIASPYGLPSSFRNSPILPKLSDIPNGTYEFYYGKAYKISFGGVATELPPEHPLYTFTPERVRFFYNLGMEFDTRFSPETGGALFPLRYVYFREGSFYTMGAPLLGQQDPLLLSFLQEEQAKKSHTPSYRPFQDEGAPLSPDGTINKEILQKFGLKIPEKSYLALGDNHAVSADSREFGFVPEENLKGAPDWIFWPPGSRFGHPNQPAYPLFTVPRLVIWLIASLSIGGAILIQRRRNRLPLL